eukprot:Polyplicarium_translucidae@DN2403_c0_g1_i1.p2
MENLNQAAIHDAVKRWNELDRDPKSVAQVKAAVDANDCGVLKTFLNRMEFGTAGLRGAMGPGFGKMNEVTVMQAAQGLCAYLIDREGLEAGAAKGVVIGFDGRHNSQRFANVTAAVFLSRGFKVYLNTKTTATPMTPFTVVKRGCIAGMQCTASHNPKQDNGWKVYAKNGAQINSPMDADITRMIEANQAWWPGVRELLHPDTGILKDGHKATDPYDEMMTAYMTDMPTELCSRRDETEKSTLRIVYTAMHGVGTPFVREIMKRFGFKNLFVVPEQEFPDPEFSTVAFPNPEEKGAMDLALAMADREGASVVIANDPDADRLAVAEKADGKWHQFTGDEMGCILGSHAIMAAEKRGIPKSKMVVVNSVVSSQMLAKICQSQGVRHVEALTGFKWMMNTALSVRESQGLTPVMVYEEALGYALSERVPDKDGVTGAAVLAELACQLYGSNSTLSSYLRELRAKHGHFVSNNSYFLCHDKPAIERLFDEFYNGGAYKWAVGNYKVVRIRDCGRNYDSGTADKKCELPSSAPSHMITLYFENGAYLTLRTSGTEPKLKWYSEYSAADAAAAKATLADVVAAVKAEVMQPQKYPLLPAK